MALLIRKRQPDGTWGPLEKVFGGETQDEKMDRLESENAAMAMMNLEKDMELSMIQEQQAAIILMLAEKEGV